MISPDPSRPAVFPVQCSVHVHFCPGFISFEIFLLFLPSPQSGEVRSARNMAASAPAHIYSLNLGLSEIGNKINQIQQQLDKTEDLVNNLSQIKLDQETSVMFERQVQVGVETMMILILFRLLRPDTEFCII